MELQHVPYIYLCQGNNASFVCRDCWSAVTAEGQLLIHLQKISTSNIRGSVVFVPQCWDKKYLFAVGNISLLCVLNISADIIAKAFLVFDETLAAIFLSVVYCNYGCQLKHLAPAIQYITKKKFFNIWIELPSARIYFVAIEGQFYAGLFSKHL